MKYERVDIIDNRLARQYNTIQKTTTDSQAVQMERLLRRRPRNNYNLHDGRSWCCTNRHWAAEIERDRRRSQIQQHTIKDNI